MNKQIPNLLLTCLLLISGCASTEKPMQAERTLDLPTWYTNPTTETSELSPVSLLMKTPEHLDIFRRKYELPGWMVYGVVRSLGARELIVTATHKTYTEVKNDLSTVMVVDDIKYDVHVNGIDQALQNIARQCALAENGYKRREVILSHLTRRSGAYVLFCLAPNQRTGMDMLTASDGDQTPMEQFSTESTETQPKPGWSESNTRYESTVIGQITNNNLFDSFRRTEEEAIYDMAKHIVIKQGKIHQASVTEKSESEVALQKNISLSIRGLRIDRRKVDLNMNTCIVTISVPKDGIAVNKIDPK